MSKRNQRRIGRGCESLELRRLLAADFGLDDGYLNIVGTDAQDAVEVWQEGDQLVVQANEYDADGGLADQRQERYPSDQVQGIFFDGRGGNDLFVNDTDRPAVALGGAGDDTLIGGGADETLVGNLGDDLLAPRSDSDLTLGSGGDNVILDGIDESASEDPSMDEAPAEGESVVAESEMPDDVCVPAEEGEFAPPAEDVESLDPMAELTGPQEAVTEEAVTEEAVTEEAVAEEALPAEVVGEDPADDGAMPDDELPAGENEIPLVDDSLPPLDPVPTESPTDATMDAEDAPEDEVPTTASVEAELDAELDSDAERDSEPELETEPVEGDGEPHVPEAVEESVEEVEPTPPLLGDSADETDPVPVESEPGSESSIDVVVETTVEVIVETSTEATIDGGDTEVVDVELVIDDDGPMTPVAESPAEPQTPESDFDESSDDEDAPATDKMDGADDCDDPIVNVEADSAAAESIVEDEEGGDDAVDAPTETATESDSPVATGEEIAPAADGNDVLVGGSGNDWAFGGGGDDWLFGDAIEVLSNELIRDALLASRQG